MRRKLSAFIVFLVLWLVLTGFNLEELVVGAGVSLILSLLVGQVIGYDLKVKDLLTLVKYVVLYMPLFIFKLIQANLQMAKIVLDPKLPIKPGFVTIKTGLKRDISKLSLANSITLTPGTLSVDLAEDTLLIHWVQVNGDNEEAMKEEICGSFEKTLGGIFE